MRAQFNTTAEFYFPAGFLTPGTLDFVASARLVFIDQVHPLDWPWRKAIGYVTYDSGSPIVGNGSSLTGLIIIDVSFNHVVLFPSLSLPTMQVMWTEQVSAPGRTPYFRSWLFTDLF